MNSLRGRRINRKAHHGTFYTGLEYWVDINDIVISNSIKDSGINENRIKREANYLATYEMYESRILLNRRFELVEGYSSILVAEHNGEKKVPVFFVD